MRSHTVRHVDPRLLVFVARRREAVDVKPFGIGEIRRHVMRKRKLKDDLPACRNRAAGKLKRIGHRAHGQRDR